MRLVAAGLCVEVADDLASLVSARCPLSRFVAGTGEPVLRLRRLPEVDCDEFRAIDEHAPEHGRYRREGDTLSVVLPDEPLLAEAALRLLYRHAALRSGGLLIHGAAIAWGGKAFVATGPSGAGKTTLARLCRDNACAAVLSDEIVALCPDGRVHGTPFWSGRPIDSQDADALLVGIVGLEHGARESLRWSTPTESTALLGSQCFRSTPGELGQVEFLKRLADYSEEPGVGWLTFRNDPAAALFMKRWMNGEAPAEFPRRALA